MISGAAVKTDEAGPDAWRRNLQGDARLEGPRDASWWTGLEPRHGRAPGVDAVGVVRGLPLPDLSRCTRADLLAYFENGWTITETLFAGLVGEEAFFRPPWHGLRHPLIFYYGHPAALYVNKMRIAGLLAGPVNADFEQIFETGVDEMSWDDLSKNEALWPTVAETREYRGVVHADVVRIIREHPDFDALPLGAAQPTPVGVHAVLMGCEHERIHIETSSVLIRELPVRLVRRHPAWPADHPSAAAGSLAPPQVGARAPVQVQVCAGTSVIGKPADWPTFGWDNEYGRREIRVAPFAAASQLVSNVEYYGFVVDGGYRDPQWWSKDGWSWRTFRNAKRPAFWQPAGPEGLHEYRLRTIFDTVEMPWDWPVVVNAHESVAYAAWRGARDGCVYRLPTEAEQHRMRGGGPSVPSDEPGPSLAQGRVDDPGFNLALTFGSEAPVSAMPANAAGFHDVFGNVWQWCQDHFAALPDFEVHPLYDDFSTPCFDGEHQVILGGSFTSLGAEAGAFARFHFRSHFHQHAGLRLVRPADPDAFVETTCSDGPGPHVGSGPCCTREGGRDAGRGSGYDSSTARDAYVLMHYGSAEQTFGDLAGPVDALSFVARVAERVNAWSVTAECGDARALDVGCAVGGSSFELARHFGDVVGIDLSSSFVETARSMAADGCIEFRRVEEGVHATTQIATAPDDVDRGRVSFRRADACALPPDLGAFDAVLLANVLCRLPSPRACLGRMGGPRGLVRPGGLLVVTTPATWDEKFTPRGAWLGGYERAGRHVTTLEALHDELGAEFDLLHREDVSCVIREHARKFEFIIPELSVWRRRA
ncbi:MAG: hypothetical protein QOG56_2287 [Solirubrobacteraceae bacterium]|nr:hypothetical protein [Solirubrobacteraceae bacterium]